VTAYDDEVADRLRANGMNHELVQAASEFMRASTSPKYSYNFSWLGRPIIQYPQDIVAMQEVVWETQPDLIIETGIAHGGSLLLYASLLELNAACGGPRGARVLGIDIDIRPHNRAAIEAHPLFKRIDLIEGSSTDPKTIQLARQAARGLSRVLVCLDSNHTHEHVLAELEAYAPLVSVGSYCVVFDTIVDKLPDGTYPDRPWGPGNSPGSAVEEFLKRRADFIADTAIDRKLMISVSPGGFLKRRA
jgi:cephalosporin hydroxylase